MLIYIITTVDVFSAVFKNIKSSDLEIRKRRHCMWDFKKMLAILGEIGSIDERKK